MSRRPVTFACAGDTLLGSLDEACGPTGLLQVSGGSEVRSGAWGGQAQLAAVVAAAGHPVFRYDRRGVGDSMGVNRGFRSSREDMAAALAAFRGACPGLRKVIAFGNCDAASALMLFAAELPIDGLLLANPWTIEGDAGPSVQSPTALRRRYLAKLTDPMSWRRLLSGGIAAGTVLGGLRQAAKAKSTSALAAEMQRGLARFSGPVTILLAERDRTAELFLDAWDHADPRVRRLPSASHSFADERARAWLVEQVLTGLRHAAPEP